MCNVASRHADLDGPVHYLDLGGDGPPLVGVHGLGGSALNWIAVGEGLAAHHRVLALDLRGFGETPLGAGTRLRDNVRLLDLFLREVVGRPATLVGNSMGGLLSVRQAAEHPDTVCNLVLVDPALPGAGADRSRLRCTRCSLYCWRRDRATAPSTGECEGWAQSAR